MKNELEKINYAIYYSYYGSLLNENQNQVLSLYFDKDFGISEIAKELGTNRQSIRQVIVTATNKLVKIEESLGIVGKIFEISTDLKELCNSIKNISDEDKNKIKEIIERIENL